MKRESVAEKPISPPLLEEFTPLFDDFRGRAPACKSAFLLAIAALEAGLDVTFSRSQSGMGTDFKFSRPEFRGARFFRVDDPKSGSDPVHYQAASVLETMSGEKLFRVRNKLEAKKAFHHAGILSPFGGTATANNLKILEAFRREGIGEVFVKPVEGSASKGVLSNVRLDLAARHIRSRPGAVFIVEQPIPGREFRAYVVDDRMVAGYERFNPHVVGDGRSTVRALIEAENAYRARHPEFSVRLIDVQSAALAMAARGKSLESVPVLGERLRVTMTTTTGASTILFPLPEADRQTLADTAVAAARALDLRSTAVDVRLDQKGRPFVIEANGRPGIAAPAFRHRGSDWDPSVSRAMISMMFPRAEWGGRTVRRFEFAALTTVLHAPDGDGVASARDYVEMA